MPLSRQERRRAERDAVKRAPPGQAGAAGAAAAGAPAARAHVDATPLGDWTTQRKDPAELAIALEGRGLHSSTFRLSPRCWAEPRTTCWAGCAGRRRGLITYPSPLLGGAARGAARGPRGRGTAAAGTYGSRLVCAGGAGKPGGGGGLRPAARGDRGGGPLKLKQFVRSVERLAWAKANDCPWVALVCALLGEGTWRCCGGRGSTTARGMWAHARRPLLEVLRWAREHDCPWDEVACRFAAGGGHQETLMWAREHDCPWDYWTCDTAEKNGHLEVLRWVRENGCPPEDESGDESGGEEEEEENDACVFTRQHDGSRLTTLP